MRLSEDQIRQGILHADKAVRLACLQYFADCYSPNPTVMPVVIEALERYGRTETFPYTHPISDLAQTEETIRWALNELKTGPRSTEDERSYLGCLSRLVCRADPKLVLPHQQDILNARGFSRDLVELLGRRLKLLSWDGDALWRELEAMCEEGKDKEGAWEFRYNEAEPVVEALARDGDRRPDRMMALLAVKVEVFEDNPMKWMEPLMVRLAGELRHEPAIPLIVGKLHEDAEVLSEECQRALIKIDTDASIQAVRRDYPTAEWHFRLYASNVLGRVHTDAAVSACIELLEKEKDLELQNWLGQSLVEHFSTEGNEVARRVLLDDPDLYDLQRALVPACTLTGQDFPELEQWRKEIEENTRRKPFLYEPAPDTTPRTAPAPPPPRPLTPFMKTDKKVGRNDPCPCGSGKKFKKCCMNKNKPF